MPVGIQKLSTCFGVGAIKQLYHSLYTRSIESTLRTLATWLTSSQVYPYYGATLITPLCYTLNTLCLVILIYLPWGEVHCSDRVHVSTWLHYTHTCLHHSCDRYKYEDHRCCRDRQTYASRGQTEVPRACVPVECVLFYKITVNTAFEIIIKENTIVHELPIIRECTWSHVNIPKVLHVHV